MNNNKLPLSVQLAAVTAVVVFCFAAISVYSYSHALIRDWGAVTSVPGWQSLLLAPGKVAILAILSAGAFSYLLYGPARTAASAASLYVGVLLVWLCWQSIYWVVQAGGWHELSGYNRIALGIRAIYFAWLCVLLYLLKPNLLLMLKRR